MRLYTRAVDTPIIISELVISNNLICIFPCVYLQSCVFSIDAQIYISVFVFENY